MDIIKNFGVLQGLFDPRAYVVGANSKIKYEVVEESGDWSKWVPSGERQKFRNFDTMACVSYRTENVISTQINRLIDLGIIRTDLITDWLDADGKFSGSDRFLAKDSNTTKNGNYMDAPPESLRKRGIPPESYWTWSDNFNWDSYYAPITQNVYDKALEFLNYFEIQYEFLPYNTKLNKTDEAEIAKHLKQAPLGAIVRTCPGWTREMPNSCSASVGNHDVMIYNLDDYYRILDNYEPYKKRLVKSYPVFSVLKVIITPKPIILKNMSNVKIVQKKGTKEVGLYVPVTSQEALYAYGLNFGLNIPSEAPNTVDWSKLKLDGEVTIT